MNIVSAVPGNKAEKVKKERFRSEKAVNCINQEMNRLPEYNLASKASKLYAVLRGFRKRCYIGSCLFPSCAIRHRAFCLVP